MLNHEVWLEFKQIRLESYAIDLLTRICVRTDLE